MEHHTIFVNNYNPKILLGKDIILDILEELIGKNKKVLVFGLGMDSKMWYLANEKKNIWFIEHDDNYIKLNSDIDSSCIIKYDYANINVKKSFSLSNDDIENYPIPDIISQNAPYDLIIVDAPTGFNDETYGRLLPIYWTAKYFSKHGTIIYVDDVERSLENYCVNKFLSKNILIKQFITTTFNRHCMTSKLVKV